MKIASYGLMHLAVAILVAFAVTRDWRLALAVGVVEPLFQTVAYAIHDRVWRRFERRDSLTMAEETIDSVGARFHVTNAQEQSRSHRHPGHSHALPRSIGRVALKTVTYGLMHFTVAVGIAYALTRDIGLALTIGAIEPLVQMAFFTVHDWLWTQMEVHRALRRSLGAA